MPVFNAVLTNQAENAALDYDNTQITLQITHVGFGTSTAVADLDQLSVLGEVGRVAVAGGGIEPNSRTLTANVIWTPDQVRDIGQIGFYAGDTLFCIYAPGVAIVRVTPDVGIAASFSVSLVRLPNGSVNIVVDNSLSPMMLLLGQHLTNPNPHPQYAMKAAFDSHVVQNGLEHANLANLISAEAQVRDTADQNLNQDVEQQQTNLLAHIDQNALEHANLLAMISALNQQISQLNAKPSVFGWAAVAIQASRVTNTILQAVITISQQSGGFSVPALDANGDNGTLEHFLFANLEADDITAKYTFLLTLPANLPANHFVFAPGWTVVDPQTLKIEYEQGTIYQPSSDDYREDESPINTSHLIQIMA